jgi:hypothetical protein
MKTFLSTEEVIELAYDALDMNCPDPDKVHDIALKMDMIYDEDMDMYQDVNNVYIRMLRHRLISSEKAKYENNTIVRR